MTAQWDTHPKGRDVKQARFMGSPVPAISGMRPHTVSIAEKMIMDELREKVEDVILGCLQFTGGGWHAKILADRILAIPEIASALKSYEKAVSPASRNTPEAR